MSPASPWGRPPGQPGRYNLLGNTKGLDWILCNWVEGNSQHCLKIKERWVGELCKGL